MSNHSADFKSDLIEPIEKKGLYQIMGENEEVLLNGNKNFSDKLLESTSLMMNLYEGMQIVVEDVEACDCTLNIFSYGQSTRMKITENGWNSESDESNLLFLNSRIIDETNLEKKCVIGNNISECYFYNDQGKAGINRNSTHRNICIDQEKLSLMILMTHFINQTIADGIKDPTEIEFVTEKSFKHSFSKNKTMKLPQGLLGGKLNFNSPYFLNQLSLYVNQRIVESV